MRWVNADTVHLTIRFLGEVPAERLERLTEALGASLSLPAFEAELCAAGVFAKRGSVRTLWLAVGDGREQMCALHDEVSARLCADGWPEEERPFTPHLTIGRVREQYARKTRGLSEAMMAAAIRPIRWRVADLVLYSSDLSGAQPVYTPVHRIALAG